MPRKAKRNGNFPKNVPKKLIRRLKELGNQRTKLANELGVNGGVLALLLNDGYEPRNPEIRKKLFLKTYSICPACKRKLMYRTKQKEAKEEIPDYLKIWNHLSKQERQTVIQQYITYKKKKEG